MSRLPALPPVRFVTVNDGVSLAYTTYGEGPALVWVANWLTHLELDWSSPVWSHWVEFFTRHHRLVRYDERGCGLSDWVDRGLDLDTWVEDLAAVIEAVGLERFDLLGISQGGPIAIEYAVRHPERVARLVLIGTYPSGNFLPDRERQALDALIESSWGSDNLAFRQLFTSLFIPDASPEQQQWFNLLQAKSTRPAIAAKLMSAFRQLDVRARLGEVRAPALVLHARGDAVVPFAAGRAVAAGIPDARFVPLESDNHIPLANTAAWAAFRREFNAFTGVGSAEASEPIAAPTDGACYRFGRCLLNARSRELFRDDSPVAVERRALDMLLYLIENRDRAVSKDELQAAIWPRMILQESALTRCVMKVRRAVGDDREHQQIIRTIHGHGYRFVAPLAQP
jgi:pimeloyl-ACP methyl ester carboxylesterase/DNA-binding winged helix-turn-helix (wHTH) protein